VWSTQSVEANPLHIKLVPFVLKNAQSKNIICKEAEGQYNNFGFQDTPLCSFCKFIQKIGTGKPWFQNKFYFDQKNKIIFDFYYKTQK